MSSFFEDYIKPVALIVTGGGGVWVVLKAVAAGRASEAVARVKQSSDMLPAIAAFQAGLNATAEQMLAGMRAELSQVKAEVKALQDENVQCRRENARLVASQQVLIEYLRGQGLTVPETALPHLITEFEDGVVRVHDVGETLRG